MQQQNIAVAVEENGGRWLRVEWWVVDDRAVDHRGWKWKSLWKAAKNLRRSSVLGRGQMWVSKLWWAWGSSGAMQAARKVEFGSLSSVQLKNPRLSA